jgi:hypothetical protein
MGPNLSTSDTRLRTITRVLSNHAFVKRYRHLKLARAELIQFCIFDFAKEEKTFVLGDIVRYLREIYPVPLIYRTMTALLEDGWFSVDQVGLKKPYTLTQDAWRPTVYQDKCVWKQAELRRLDETRVQSRFLSKQPVDPISVCDSARVAILKIMADGKTYTSPDMIKILARRGFNARTIRSAFHSLNLDRYLDVDKAGVMYQKKLKEHFLQHPEFLNDITRLSYYNQMSS